MKLATVLGAWFLVEFDLDVPLAGLQQYAGIIAGLVFSRADLLFFAPGFLVERDLAKQHRARLPEIAGELFQGLGLLGELEFFLGQVELAGGEGGGTGPGVELGHIQSGAEANLRRSQRRLVVLGVPSVIDQSEKVVGGVNIRLGVFAEGGLGRLRHGGLKLFAFLDNLLETLFRFPVAYPARRRGSPP